MRVAIIGCGPSGMSALAAFNQAEKKGEKIPEIVCYEKQASIGGLWNYTWRTGTDEHGEQCHNSMYRYLWSNGPKECLEMGDYTFEEHFGHQIPSYPPRLVLKDYLMGKAKKNDIMRFVQLNTVIRNVEERDDQFLVSSYNQETKQSKFEVFDYVIVASGHFSVPSIPDYPGIEDFKGRIMHSHDFRDAAGYEGKTLLFIGNKYSSEDIALQCYKYNSTNNSIISYRSKPTGYTWPEGIIEIPQLTNFENGKFHFVDGSSHAADVLIFCSGYLHYFPFMSGKLRLHATNTLYPDNLYKGIIFKQNSKLIYLGMQDQYYTFSMFDAQAWFARDYILGKINFKESDMLEDIKQWRQRFLEMKSDEDVDFQKDYVRDLLSFTDFPEHGTDERAALWKKWKVDRKNNIVEYRDQSFASVISGKMAPDPKVPWMKNMDDSVKDYIDYKEE